MKKVAITGGIATGKSTVLNILSEVGYSTASADEMARHLLAEEQVRVRLCEITGLSKNFSQNDLWRLIAKSDKQRNEIDGLLHPLIWDEMKSSSAQFFEIPLLFEVGLQHFFYEIWTIFCEEQTQRERFENRYGSERDFSLIQATQMPILAKVALADWVLRTDQSIETVREMVLNRATAVASIAR